MAWKPTYADRDDLADFVRIEDTADDAQLNLAVEAASRAVDRFCGRQFGLVETAEDRYYTAQLSADGRRWLVAIDDLMTTTGLVVAYDDTELTGYRLAPANAAADRAPWTEIVFGRGERIGPLEDAVCVTGRFGWTSVPDAVKQATLLQASRIFARRDAPFGIAGSPDSGSEMRLLAKVDVDVEVMLRDYRRRWLGV